MAFLSLYLFLLLVLALAGAHGQTYFGSVDFVEGAKVKWDINGQTVTFQVSCPAAAANTRRRWIGLGFHTGSELKADEEADFYFASLGPAGLDPQYQDSSISSVKFRGDPNYAVSKDDILNMDIVEPITRNETFISVKFSRKLDTCDKKDQLLTTGTTFMIVACGAADNADLTQSPAIIPTGPRTFFAIVPVHLFTENSPAVFEPTVPSITIKMNNLNPWPAYSGPSWMDPKLYYACKLEKLPSYEEVRSIIGYSPVLDSSPSTAVVSIHLRMCKPGVNVEVAKPWETSVINCQPDLPAVANLLADCSETIASWFPDSKAYRFPDKVGYPVGKAEYADRFVLLQVVYDTKVAALPSNSLTGLQLYFSDEALEQKAGVLTVSSSSSVSLVIPPKRSEFRVRTFCDTQCTNKFLPRGGIALFSVVHQTRKLGREVRTRLIRNGKEVQLISDDVSHASTFQVPRAISPAIWLQPGDQILVECTYDSTKNIPPFWSEPSKDNVPIFGGVSSADEICAASFRYYPRIKDFFTCGSAVEPRHVFPLLGLSDYESFFNVNGSDSQYLVLPNAVKEQFRLDKLKLEASDKCLAPRIHGLYYSKRHVPSCGLPNLSLFSTANIELLPLAAPQCPGDAVPKIYENPLPASCSDAIFQDEINDQITCRKNSVGIASVSFFLTVCSSILSVVYKKSI